VEQIETKRERRIVGYGEDAEEFEGEWVKVKLYSAHEAQRDILKMHGKLVKKMEVTGKDGESLIPPVDHEAFDQSMKAFTNAIVSIIEREDSSKPES
jgi:hypothetical protein